MGEEERRGKEETVHLEDCSPIARAHDDIIVFYMAEENNDVIMRSCL